MPALVICGHKSKLGGDDLSLISIIIATLRIVEVVLLIPAGTLTFIEYQERLDEGCMGHRAHKARIGLIPIPYFAMSIFFAVFTICLSMRIYQISGRGSPTQPELRKGMGTLFAIQLFFTPLVLLGLSVVGIIGVLYVDTRIKCIGHVGSKPTWFGLFVATLFFQCAEVFVYAVVLFRWLKFELQNRIIPGEKDNETKSIEARADEWNNKCRCCCKYTALSCCFSFGGRGIENEDFSSMAQVLTELFDGGGTLDIVLSDVIAAFIAIALEQEDHKQKCIERLKREASGDPSAMALIDQATTSNNAFTLSENISVLLDMFLVRDVESGTAGNRVKSNFFLDAATTKVKKQEEEDRKNAFIFVKGSQTNGDGDKFAIRELLSPTIDIDRYVIAEGARFLQYSIAINTAKGYLFADSTHFCKLGYARCCELPKHRQENEENVIVGGDSFGLHEAALMKVIGFDKSKVELFYAHLDKHAVDEAVYCILVDHVWKSVVLCIRGSLSLEDYVVNLQLDPEELTNIGVEYGFDGVGEYCHKGYLGRAKWICNDLKSHGILDHLLNKETGQYRDYEFRVTGHSLGAGSAAPVALMLRQQYPNLRCICFAPPGGLFSEGIAARSKAFVTTYVLNTDLVPRISARTVEKLRDEVLQMIARIKIPKRQLIKINQSGKKLTELPLELEDLLHPADDIPDSRFKVQLDRFKQRQKESQNTKKILLYPPGNFVHFVRTMSSQDQRLLQGRLWFGDLFNCVTCDRFVAEDKHAPRYAPQSDFNKIVVSSTLVSDHMVETVELALNLAAEVFGVYPNAGPPPMNKGS